MLASADCLCTAAPLIAARDQFVAEAAPPPPMSVAHGQSAAASADTDHLRASLLKYMRKLKLNRANLAFLLELTEERSARPPARQQLSFDPLSGRDPP